MINKYGYEKLIVDTVEPILSTVTDGLLPWEIEKVNMSPVVRGISRHGDLEAFFFQGKEMVQLIYLIESAFSFTIQFWDNHEP